MLETIERLVGMQAQVPSNPYVALGCRWIGRLLADGFFRGYWKVEDGTLTVDRLKPRAGDPPSLRDDIVAEGERLPGVHRPGAARRRTAFAP